MKEKVVAAERKSDTASDIEATSRNGVQNGTTFKDSTPASPPDCDLSVQKDHHLLQNTKNFSLRISHVSIARSPNGSVQDKADSSNESRQPKFISPTSPESLETSVYYTCPTKPLQATPAVSPTAVPYLTNTPQTLLKQQKLNATYIISPETLAEQASPLSGLLSGNTTDAPQSDLCTTTVIKSCGPPQDNQTAGSPKPADSPTSMPSIAPLDLDGGGKEVISVSGAGQKRQHSFLAGRVSPTLTSPPKRLLLSPEEKRESALLDSSDSQEVVAPSSPEEEVESLSSPGGTYKNLGKPTSESKLDNCLADSGVSQRDVVACVLDLACSEAATGHSQGPDTTATQPCNCIVGQSPPDTDEIPKTGGEVESVHSTDPQPSDATLSARPTFLQAWNQMKSNKVRRKLAAIQVI